MGLIMDLFLNILKYFQKFPDLYFPRYLSYGLLKIHRKLTSCYLPCDKASLSSRIYNCSHRGHIILRIPKRHDFYTGSTRVHPFWATPSPAWWTTRTSPGARDWSCRTTSRRSSRSVTRTRVRRRRRVTATRRPGLRPVHPSPSPPCLRARWTKTTTLVTTRSCPVRLAPVSTSSSVIVLLISRFDFFFFFFLFTLPEARSNVFLTRPVCR